MFTYQWHSNGLAILYLPNKSTNIFTQTQGHMYCHKKILLHKFLTIIIRLFDANGDVITKFMAFSLTTPNARPFGTHVNCPNSTGQIHHFST